MEPLSKVRRPASGTLDYRHKKNEKVNMYITHFDINVTNKDLKHMALPMAVRDFSISPFISRSIALATSTLLYLEYLSNTGAE